jgi:hypothetical protein
MDSCSETVRSETGEINNTGADNKIMQISYSSPSDNDSLII